MSELNLSVIARRIRSTHSKIVKAGKQMLAWALEAGKDLAAVKAGIKHGQWESWLKDEAGMETRTAQLYMQLWENREAIAAAAGPSELTISESLRMIRAAKKSAAEPAQAAPAPAPAGQPAEPVPAPAAPPALPPSAPVAPAAVAPAPEPEKPHHEIDVVIPVKPLGGSAEVSVQANEPTGQGASVGELAEGPAVDVDDLAEKSKLAQVVTDPELDVPAKVAKLLELGGNKLVVKLLQQWRAVIDEALKSLGV